MIGKKVKMRQKSTCVCKSKHRKGYKYTKKPHRCYKRSSLLNHIIGRIQKVRPTIFTAKKSKKIFCTEDTCVKPEDGPSQYAIYCLVNTSYFANKGNLAASVARGFLKLFNKVDSNRAKASVLNDWEDSGEKLVVLDGINHRHLSYLEEEMQYAATATDLLYQNWGKSRLILVLSVLGREEDLEELLDGLNYVR